MLSKIGQRGQRADREQGSPTLSFVIMTETLGEGSPCRGVQSLGHLASLELPGRPTGLQQGGHAPQLAARLSFTGLRLPDRYGKVLPGVA